MGVVSKVKGRCALVSLMFLIHLSPVGAQDVAAVDKRIKDKLTLEQITDAVVSALPPGTPFAKIEKYLTDNGIEHSYYKPTNQFLAAIRNIKGGGLLVSKDALITITLNKDGFLEKIAIEAALNAP